MGSILNHNIEKLHMYKKGRGHIIHLHLPAIIWEVEYLWVGFAVQRPTNMNQWATQSNPANNQEND